MSEITYSLPRAALTISEAAVILGCGYRTIERRIRDKRLARNIDGKIPAAEIERYLRESVRP